MEILTERTPAGVGILKKCKTCRWWARCNGLCVAQDKANTRLAEYEATGLTPEQVMDRSWLSSDAHAHAVFGDNLLRRRASAYCRRCGTDLETAYHEERLYSVACPDCKTVTLVKASNPDEAARIVGEPIPCKEWRA